MQAFQGPLLAVQALLKGPGTAASGENKDAENAESGEHNAGESAPGPESGSEAERGSVEGPDEAGAAELGSVENDSGADAEGVTADARKDDAPRASGQAQTVHGADFGESDQENRTKPTAETDEPSSSEKAEAEEEGGYPPNLQFPKWEIPAFMILFIGLPNRWR